MTALDAIVAIALIALLISVLALAVAVNAVARDQRTPTRKRDAELDRQLAEIRSRRSKVAQGGGRIVGARIVGGSGATTPPPSRAAVKDTPQRDTQRNPVTDDGRDA